MKNAEQSSGRHIVAPAVPANPLELAGVDPLRQAEIRRRVAAVKAYIDIPSPTDMDRRYHAEHLDLSVNQFLALVRAWREHGNAAAIAGAGAARGKPRSAGPRSLPTLSKDAAREVVAALGPDVPHVEAVRTVKARCASLGVRAPSRSTIWNMVMAVRRDAAQATKGNNVVVARCHTKLPVEHDGKIIYPWIVLAVDATCGAILAATMNDESGIEPTLSPALFRLPADRQILFDQEIASRISAELPPHIIVRPSAARTATAKALGRGFGTIELIYQLSRAIDPGGLLRSRKDRALSPVDAQRVILEQLTVHNAARGAPQPRANWEA